MSQPLPTYMERGSKGSVVNLVLVFLAGWAWGRDDINDEPFTRLRCDAELGETGVECLKIYQEVKGITVDGGCGPETRDSMAEGGLDLDEVARITPGMTVFVQLNGDALPWSSEALV